MNYDVIGDIHGHADALEKLLQKLGYQIQNGIYNHPKGRKVIFLGDFIDRGPKIRETLHIAKNMCDAGNAYAIMGNHEFNAVSFHSPDKVNGGFYRKHSFTEINQHYETLKQFQGFENEWLMFLEWFKVLPLFIEKDNFKAVHAYWNDNNINWIKQNYGGKLTNTFLASANKKGTQEYNVIEETLKGKEFQLPKGVGFHDKDGTYRDRCRLIWWQSENKRTYYKDILLLCPVNFGNKLIEETDLFNSCSNKTIFFGHYWLKGDPLSENKKAICLDYSVAKNGKLVAFRSEYLKLQNNYNEGFAF